ncbi:MAG: hypothetical protein VX438_16660, partial [Planctomycetota bacterium]|nr:hypothetical protein [Planctomycetota bacterium]
GVAEIAKEFSIRHFPEIVKNDEGTPQTDSVFAQAIDAAGTPLMMYVNSDIILNSSLPETIQRLLQMRLGSFLSIGQRTDFDQEELLTFSNSDWEQELLARVNQSGDLASILCKDYFIFPRERFRDMPAFSIGRGNWDNWMVAETVKENFPVIDVTSWLFAGHQNHGYAHAGGRMKAYVTGAEAKRNKQLAGGSHYVSGSVATHRLTKRGVLKKNGLFPMFSFIWDFPRAAKLVYRLWKQ